ncbi:MAG: Smr/MutS family protein [Candidatus Adiutrix sp.]|nr:Smr/MutS family protein [Candidatus Adiutrix sp.]
MDDNTLKLLEYEAALAWLAEEAGSGPGRAAALALRPDLTPEAVLESWRLIEEGREVLAAGPGPDLAGHLDLSPALERLKAEGARLDVDELSAVGREARAIGQARALFSGLAEAAPGLAALAAGLTAQNELAEAIERTVGPDGEILDSASPELARLRLEQAAARQGLIRKMTGLMRSEAYRHIIQDEVVTTRSDRFVIPVRASAAGRGLAHDWSKTGATAFMEPLETVADNNNLSLLKRREKAEIERILRRLSASARLAAPALAASGAILTRLDLILAQARLARLWSAARPEYRPGAGLNLKKARHPLLMRRLARGGGRMTPLDLVIEPQAPLLAVSGLNTGGKTVALKTLGLNMLICRAGLLPAAGEDSRLDLTEVMAVIGDEQDLGSDLSTFSGHIRSLNKVLSAARPGLLILLDEIGAGTDPAEGAALGLAVLETLRQSGALIMAATHYQLIKTWAALTPGVVSAAVNSSDSGQPLYGLAYGSPGFSGGLKMARRLGLPEELVRRAEESLDDGQRRAMELLARLDEERTALARAREAAEEEKMELARRADELRRQRETQAAEFERAAAEQNRAVSQTLAQVAREFELLKKEMRAAALAGGDKGLAAFGGRRSEMERRLSAVRPRPPAAESPQAEVREGDEVLVKTIGRLAVVRSVNPERGEAWVEAGGLNVKVPVSALFPPDPEKQAKKQTVNITVSPARAWGQSLNLLGLTVEEALGAIEKEIDQAALSGRATLHIIHGFGTGRLRQGIRSFLKNHPRVRDFERAPQNAGGDGVTVVNLI